MNFNNNFDSKKEFLDEIGTAEEVPIFLPDGYEKALIGYTHATTQTVAVYNYKTCIEILMNRDKMTIDEAIEYFDYNTMGVCQSMGEASPIFINLFE